MKKPPPTLQRDSCGKPQSKTVNMGKIREKKQLLSVLENNLYHFCVIFSILFLVAIIIEYKQGEFLGRIIPHNPASSRIISRSKVAQKVFHYAWRRLFWTSLCNECSFWSLFWPNFIDFVVSPMFVVSLLFSSSEFERQISEYGKSFLVLTQNE